MYIFNHMIFFYIFQQVGIRRTSWNKEEGLVSEITSIGTKQQNIEIYGYGQQEESNDDENVFH
jgi:hypothetical protein